VSGRTVAADLECRRARAGVRPEWAARTLSRARRVDRARRQMRLEIRELAGLAGAASAVRLRTCAGLDVRARTLSRPRARSRPRGTYRACTVRRRRMWASRAVTRARRLALDQRCAVRWERTRTAEAAVVAGAATRRVSEWLGERRTFEEWHGCMRESVHAAEEGTSVSTDL
jgi:hypothetical protein